MNITWVSYAPSLELETQCSLVYCRLFKLPSGSRSIQTEFYSARNV